MRTHVAHVCQASEGMTFSSQSADERREQEERQLMIGLNQLLPILLTMRGARPRAPGYNIVLQTPDSGMTGTSTTVSHCPRPLP